MTRPSRRFRVNPEAPASTADDNGPDGIDWDTSTIVPTSVTVEESDGSPSVVVNTLKVDAADFTLTDDGSGVATLTTDEPDAAAHIADSSDAHDASAISFVPVGTIAATNVQDAIAEVASEAGSGSLTDHTHEATGSGSNGGGASLAPTTLILPQGSSPAQTAEGSAVWDTDDDKLTIGTGAARKTLVNEGAATGSGLTMATARLLGRTTASTGAIEEISVGSGLTLSGGNLSATGGSGSSGARYPVQEKGGSGVSNTVRAVTLDATPSTSNVLILVSNAEGGQDITGIAQTNMTWTLLAKSAAGVAPVLEVWKGVYGGSGTPGTVVTATYSGSASFGKITVQEWSGLAGTLDTSATTHTTTGTFTQAAARITPSVATALVIAVFCQTSFGTTYSITFGFQGSRLMQFATSSASGGNNSQGAFWGFPGGDPVIGYCNNTNSAATQTTLTVAIV